MKILKHHKGQTLVETAFVLLILVLIAMGLVEFARAWYTKSSLKNAARQGARVAVVTPASSLPSGTDFYIYCYQSTTCPNTDNITNAVCCQPGVPKKDDTTIFTTVRVYCRDNSTPPAAVDCQAIPSGGEIEVEASAPFVFVIGNSPSWPWSNQTFTTNATMRYEQ